MTVAIDIVIDSAPAKAGQKDVVRSLDAIEREAMKTQKAVNDAGRSSASALNRAAAKVGTSVRAIGTGVRRQMSQLKNEVLSLQGFITGALSGLFVGFLGKNIAEYERLQTALETVAGSADKAEQVFAGLRDFASNTPFQLQEITDGYIKLKARGLDPTERSLTSFGNTASAMGKSLDQFIEAVADATTGEFERLKEFGIKANKEGDRIKLSFGGVTTQIENNAEAINEYLTSIGENEFGGAMEKQAQTLGGIVSNLQDKIFNLTTQTGEAGLAGAFKSAVRFASSLVDFADKALIAYQASLHNIFGAVQTTVLNTKREFELLAAFLGHIWANPAEAMRSVFAAAIRAISNAIGNVPFLSGIAEKGQQAAAGIEAGIDPADRLSTKLAEINQRYNDQIALVKQVASEGASFVLDSAVEQRSGGGNIAAANEPLIKEPDSTAGGIDEKTKSEIKAEELKREALLATLRTEEEKAMLDYERRQEQIQSLITDEEAKNLALQTLEEQHQNRMVELVRSGEASKTTIEKLGTDARKKLMKGAFKDSLGILKNNLGALFGEGKKAAQANVIINTADAAIQSFRNAGGYPWGIIPAALMVAAGAKQLSTIKKTKKDGSGSVTPTTGGGGGGAGAIGSAVSSAIGNSLNDEMRPNGQAQQINLTVTGDYISSRDFAEAVNGSLTELYKDGAQAPITVVAA